MTPRPRAGADRPTRLLAPLLLAWLVCVTVACVGLVWAERSGREALTERFAGRSDARAELVSSYVEEVFAREERLAADLASGDVPRRMFAESAHLLGFEAAVLLDREGRALATAPAAPELVGQDLASRYDHLAAALGGERAVSGAVESAVRHEPIVAFALPVEDGDVAVVSAGFRLSRSPLQTLLGEVALPGARGNLVDATGTPIVDTDAPAFPQDLLAAAREHPVATEGRVVTASAVPISKLSMSPRSSPPGPTTSRRTSARSSGREPSRSWSPTGRIDHATRAMTQLIDDLLAFTASGSAQNLERAEVDLDTLVDEVTRAMSTGGEAPVVEHGTLGTVPGNPALLRQLLSNLLGNAVKYVAEGVRPHVVVATRDTGTVVELTVTDNGIGIPASQRDRVFEPFYRAEGALAYAGTGLGLAICQRTMQVHGGSIRAEPAPIGTGSAFVCTFPVTGTTQDVSPADDLSRGGSGRSRVASGG